ncbi:hypothetical protein MBLNU459_g2007t1 [Dothideomycetes sp. NU459]
MPSMSERILLRIYSFSTVVLLRPIMIPTNFSLIKMNEEKGGSRSAKSASENDAQPGDRSAEDSVDGKGKAPQFTDLSGPQEQTDQSTYDEDDKEMRKLLDKFAVMNSARAVVIGVGGMIGLCMSLA